MEKHHTDTFVDEKNGVQAFCLTCRAPIGVMHGKHDGMPNLLALAKCRTERWEHEAGTRQVIQ
jgi:hypothetical protein